MDKVSCDAPSPGQWDDQSALEGLFGSETAANGTDKFMRLQEAWGSLQALVVHQLKARKDPADLDDHLDDKN